MENNHYSHDAIYCRGAKQGFCAGIIFSVGIGIMMYGWILSGFCVALTGAVLFVETWIEI